MDKELHEALAQVTMYSKMGRYISNKILKYNKHSKSHRNLRHSQKPESPSEGYVKARKVRDNSYSESHSSPHNKFRITVNNSQPSIGYYKVSYCQV